MMKSIIRNILLGLVIITMILFIIDSLIDTYGISENEKIIIDIIKIQDYVRSSAISLLMLIITIYIIEYYFRKKLDELNSKNQEQQLDKALLLLILSLKNYQKSLYFLLYSEKNKDIFNYEQNFPFSYLANIYEISIKISSVFYSKTRLGEFYLAHKNLIKNLNEIFLNSNLKSESNLYKYLEELILQLDEHNDFESIVFARKENELIAALLGAIQNKETVPELVPSNGLNPFINLYNSINSVLIFKDKIKKEFENKDILVKK